MGLSRTLVVACAIGAVACGTLFGFGGDDETPIAPANEDAAGSLGDPDGTTVFLDAEVPDVIAITPDAGKIVFLSSKTSLPTFDGGAVDGADAFCDSLAAAAGITGRSFHAYLYDRVRFRSNTSESDAGWFLRDGRLAFAGPDIDEPLVAVDVDEHGTKPDAAARVWIGAASVIIDLGGILGISTVSKSCSDWTSIDGGEALTGDARDAAAWDNDGDRACNVPRHVYCFER